MKGFSASFTLIIMASVAISGIAWADAPRSHGHHFHGHHHRGHFGVFIGAPWPWYYPPPYYYPYYPGTIVVPSSPPQYIERSDEAAASTLPPGYWYYCRNPDGYYPYVKECPGGWQQVAPQPPSH